MYSFAELRTNLSLLSAQGTVLHLSQLQFELRKLRDLRKSWFGIKPIKRPFVKIDEILDQTESVKVTVKETPVEVSYAKPRIHSAPAPVSVSYNAERYLPYRVLWAKVIIRATYDYALWKDSPDLRLRKFAEDAEKWLFEPSDLELSFENICFAFDFPAEKIRQKTRTLTRNDVKKLEFRERQGRGSVEDTSNGNSK